MSRVERAASRSSASAICTTWADLDPEMGCPISKHLQRIVAMNPYCPPKVQRLICATGLGHQLFGHVSALLLPLWGEEETRTAESRNPPRCARSLRDYAYFGSRSRTSLQSVEKKLKQFRISDILIWSPVVAISSLCNIYHVLCRLLRRTFNFSWIWSPMTAISSFCITNCVLCRKVRLVEENI